MCIPTTWLFSGRKLVKQLAEEAVTVGRTTGCMEGNPPMWLWGEISWECALSLTWTDYMLNMFNPVPCEKADWLSREKCYMANTHVFFFFSPSFILFCVFFVKTLFIWKWSLNSTLFCPGMMYDMLWSVRNVLWLVPGWSVYPPGRGLIGLTSAWQWDSWWITRHNQHTPSGPLQL